MLFSCIIFLLSEPSPTFVYFYKIIVDPVKNIFAVEGFSVEVVKVEAISVKDFSFYNRHA